MADQNIDGLIVAIKADLSDYITKLDQMQQKTSTTADKVSVSLTKVGDRLGILGAAFAGFSATAIKSAMDWGNAVDDLSDKTGLAGEKSSELLLIAKRVGIGAEEAGGMFAKFARSAHTAAQAQADAAVQGKKSTDVYSRLGITLTKSDGTLKETADLFGEVKNAIMELPDGLQKTAMEMELFGRSGAAMHDMLNMTESEMQAVIEKGRALGLVMSTEQAAAWEKFSRDVSGAKGTLTAIGITIGNEVMPHLRELLDKVTLTTKAFKDLDGPQKNAIDGLVEFAGKAAAGAIVARVLGLAIGASLGPWGLIAGAIWASVDALNAYIDSGKKLTTVVTGNADWDPFGLLTGKVKEYDFSGMDSNVARRADMVSSRKAGTGGGGGGYTGNAGGSAKTELEQYLANLTEYKDIWARQIELGQISQTQFRDLLKEQLAGLEAINVGEDERLSKERGLYDLKSLMRQAEMALISEQRARTERDFAAQTITEKQHHEQRKAQLQAEIAMTAAGSEKRYAKEKELIDLETQFADKQRQRYLTNIGYQQQLANAEIAILQEQMRHQQRMQAIGAIGTTENQLEKNAAAEREILERQYQANLKAVNERIAQYNTGYERDADNLKAALQEKSLLENKYNADSLKAANRLEEQKAELQRQTASEYSKMIADMITGTATGQDIMQQLWTDFVQKVIEKLLTINKVTNIVDSIIGSLFGGGGGSGISGSGLSDKTYSFIPRAGGGPVEAGKTYLVGEQRPEIFVPTTSGTILPDARAALAGAAGNNLPVEVNVINNTGVQATPSVSTSFDFDKKIITVVLDAVQRDVMGTRTMIKGLARIS